MLSSGFRARNRLSSRLARIVRSRIRFRPIDHVDPGIYISVYIYRWLFILSLSVRASQDSRSRVDSRRLQWRIQRRMNRRFNNGACKTKILASNSLRCKSLPEHRATAMSVIRIHRRRTRWEPRHRSRARCSRSEGRLGPWSRSWSLWTQRLHHQWGVAFWGRGLGFQNVALVGAVVSSWAGVERTILELWRALDGSELHTQLVSSRG